MDGHTHKQSRAGSVLKRKPRFSVKTEPKPKPRFCRDSKSVLRPHKVTEDTAYNLSDAVFKFFLTVTNQHTD